MYISIIIIAIEMHGGPAVVWMCTRSDTPYSTLSGPFCHLHTFPLRLKAIPPEQFELELIPDQSGLHHCPPHSLLAQAACMFWP